MLKWKPWSDNAANYLTAGSQKHNREFVEVERKFITTFAIIFVHKCFWAHATRKYTADWIKYGVNFSNSCIAILLCLGVYLNELARHLYFTLIDLIY